MLHLRSVLSVFLSEVYGEQPDPNKHAQIALVLQSMLGITPPRVPSAEEQAPRSSLCAFASASSDAAAMQTTPMTGSKSNPLHGRPCLPITIGICPSWM